MISEISVPTEVFCDFPTLRVAECCVECPFHTNESEIGF